MSAPKLDNTTSNKQYLERTQRNHFFIGDELGQQRIKELKIGVAGLGGMGSNIAEYLARLGVGSLSLADADTIDLSNINRQVIANLSTLGKRKIDASIHEIKNIDPEIQIKEFADGVTKENVYEFIKDCDFIVDEIDVFPVEAHQILHKACREKNIPIYSAYVIGLGVHFYKFHGNEFTFEDFLDVGPNESPQDKLDKIIDSFMSKRPEYLGIENLNEYKKMALKEGVPIFGPSCLLGHTIVLSRILCDFLDCNLLGTQLPKTPVMPEFVKVDLMTLEISVENYLKK
ncbi:MAG: hypothetical protein CME63_09835 [Halobacteriovoraceae bacterium]|jgi:molybdopterin/thiamine biosynthesis adenylyltransferase|nr:hypothetical protein [Halobacteriovoraceae bacterium]|tara:strand:- start:32210 stop:33070 length:861 start_codon:yes stop_codon:yes gene_type:complete